jgi:hypothetical protein
MADNEQIEKIEFKAEEIKARMAVIIQKNYRKYKAQMKYLQVKKNIVIIQHGKAFSAELLHSIF